VSTKLGGHHRLTKLLGHQDGMARRSLWTLKIEVMFCLLAPLMVTIMRRFGYLRVLLTLYALSITYSVAMNYLSQGSEHQSLYTEVQRKLPGQLTYFVAGALGYYYLPEFSRYGCYLAVVAGLAFATQYWLPWPKVEPFALGVVVIFAACVAPYLDNFGKYGDFSYGIYILHFPLLQTMVSLGWFNENVVSMVFVVAALLLLLAVVLWYTIEQPWLRQSSRYRSVAHVAE
jgi:peptidoglycan/LPS O-acetylase OafA/YrhL